MRTHEMNPVSLFQSLFRSRRGEKESPQATGMRSQSLSNGFTDSAWGDFIEAAAGAGIVSGYFEKELPFYSANRYFFQMLGYASQEAYIKAIDGKVTNSLCPEETDALRLSVGRQLESTGGFSLKHRLKKSDGAYLVVQTQGKLMTTQEGRRAILCVARDITENERTIHQLADQLHLYRASQSAAAYRILLDKELTLLYGNDLFFQMMDYTPESFQEKLGGKCAGRVYPEDLSAVFQEAESALTREDNYADWYMRIFTGTGTLRYIHVMGTFAKTPQGVVMEGLGVDVTQQKTTEQTLFERSAMFDILLENSNLSMWTYDIKTKTATLISSKKHQRPMSYNGTAGYPESVIATGFIRQDSVENLRALLKKVDAGVNTACGDVWYHPENSESWCDKVTYVNIRSNDGEIIRTVGFGEDVTQQRIAQQQYEEELEYQQTVQSENLLTKVRANLTKNILESYESAAAVRICRDHMPYDQSVEALSQTGYTQEDRDLILRMLNTGAMLDAFERGQHFFSFHYRRKTNDGRAVWVNISIKTYRDMQSGEIKSFMYTVDINKEKINEQIVQTVAATEHDYIVLIDLNGDEFRQFTGNVNDTLLPSAQARKGYTRFVTEISKTYVHPDDMDRCIRDMQPEQMRIHLSQTKLYSAVYRVFDKNRELHHKKIQYTWLNEPLAQVIMTRSDVTDVVVEQARQQELLKNALIQAEQANNAKTDFLSKMSHEIRTPMNAIIGMNALAAQNIQDPEIAGDCISKVGISARYLLTLINDILDMSRIESGKINLRNELIPFEEFVNSVNTVVCEQTNAKGLSYDAIITGYVADSYMGDAMKLQQILINLLGNAVKFTPKGGKVQLMMNQERVEGSKAYLRFTVNDTGVGISEEFQKVMFEPFEQENTSGTVPYGGTGLGLAITKNLVTIMGGHISVNSILGVGTEFVVTIPLGVVAQQKAYTCDGGVHLEKMNALIVDDEILICQQTQELLADIGMKAEWVTSGYKAVERVRERFAADKTFDIILVDWKMPDMDGIETARQMRRILGPEVTIIIITAYEWAEIEKEAKAAGVNLLITKPLFKSTLVSTFERILTPRVRSEGIPIQRKYDFTGRRVLLVEDHLLNVEVARRLLTAKGMAVEVAENGLAAIEAFASRDDGYFDGILMDIRMPVMDGLTATRSIRQMKKASAKTIPIIAMSANAFEEDMEKSRAAGMNAHLSKPIEPELLYETMVRFMDKGDEKKDG